MSDYESVRSDAEALRERAIDLEVEYQFMMAHSGHRDDYEWTNEEILEGLNMYEAEFRDAIATWFADLTEIFDELADLPDPATFAGPAEALVPALTQLAGPSGHTDVGAGSEYSPAAAYEKLQSIPAFLQDWNGVAADAFKSNFIPPLERVAHHEFEAVVSLRSPLLAEAAMWEKARQDVVNLIRETNAALDDYQGGKDGADIAFALTIIGAVVAVAAVPFTGGSSAALYWAIAGSSIAVTGAVVSRPPEEKKELTIKGESPSEIINSMREAIWDLKLVWLEHELFIKDQMFKLQDLMQGYTAPDGAHPRPRGYPYYSSDHTYSEQTTHEFTLPRPALADATPGNINDDDHMGKPD